MDIRAPLLAQGEEDPFASPSPSPSGRRLSVSALAPARRSTGSLRSVATQPGSGNGDDAPSPPRPGSRGGGDDGGSQRTSLLRFAPMPPSGLQSPRVSSTSDGSLQGRGSGGLGRAGSGGIGGGGAARDAHVLHRTASTKLLHLSAAYQSRRQLEEQEGFKMPPFVIHPYDVRANFWWAFIALAVLVTMLAEPAFLAFAKYPGFYPGPDTTITSLLITAYALDIVFNFFVAYHDADGLLVVDRRRIAANYARVRLWVDLATTIPFDWIVLGVMGLRESDTVEARYISMLRLIRLARVYRLKKWADYLTTNTSVSLLWVTILRNALVLFYTTHIGACIFFFLARQTEGAVITWFDAAHARFTGNGAGGMAEAGTFGKYVFSLYWSAVTFATVGYGDIHAETVAEAAFITLFIYINVFVGAYIIGTITLLVTRSDEETGRYRSELAVLEQYGATHAIPQDLQSAMRGHLRLHYSAQESSDERVLAVLPSALRRRVLGHMYGVMLAESWLLDGCHQKFLDAFLGAAKMEHVMPKVEIVGEGDLVNELMILVAGTCVMDLPRPGSAASAAGDVFLTVDDGSFHGGGGAAARSLEAGDPLAEMAFFTEAANLQAVRTVSVCRVLSLSRTAYMALAAAFPLSAERILANLLDAAQMMVERETRLPPSALAALEARPDLGALSLDYASPELLASNGAAAAAAAASKRGRGGPPAEGGGGGGGEDRFDAAAPPGRVGGPLRQGQRMALSNLARVRTLVEAQRRRLQRDRTAEFLEAAAHGNVAQLRAMMQQGLDPNSADYDGRTALMLAAGRGQLEAAAVLLAAGADPSAVDALQGCALLEAARGGHDAILEALLAAGARMYMNQVACAAHLCTAVFEGDVPLLRRLARAGMDPDAGDYDGRRAAHIAASETALAALKVLAEEVGADLSVTDRWGATPLDEARRGGAGAAAAYLERMGAQAGIGGDGGGGGGGGGTPTH
ncbi:MAG: hypothetical protein J3K34DRAFT_276757 [Monoraphidium minutum]|nr:MAG: hypothetical protein J3K34DRAFT_276757 [Monoraphidium minutum]